MKSGEVVIMTVFGAHLIKEVSRRQLISAAKNLLSKEERKQLNGAEKSKFIKPLANQFIDRGIVRVRSGCSLSDLSMGDVEKIGNF